MLDDEFERSDSSKEAGFDTAFLIAVTFCVLLGFVFAVFFFNTGSDDLTKLEGRINPNIAEQAALKALPGIGPSKAAAIIFFRQQLVEGPNKVSFKKAEDLQKVKGIGEKTAENIKPFLKFE